MILYLDTSAWVRLYVDEPGRAEVVSAVRESEAIATHLIAHAELHAALAKAVRMGRLDRSQRDAIAAQMDRDWARMLVVQVDEPLVFRAGVLALEFGLRGYDSVHLAAVERLGAHAGSANLHFACFDDSLAVAARRMGIRDFLPQA